MGEYYISPDEIKKIIRVVIKGASGYTSVDEAFKDKLTITRDSIRYEYIPMIATEINPVRRWSYKTTSPIFQKYFDDLTRLIPGMLVWEGIFIKDVGPITFLITYADNTKEKREFYLSGDDFKEVFSVVKKMVPGCEYVPAVLLTSEDYAEFDGREDE